MRAVRPRWQAVGGVVLVLAVAGVLVVLELKAPPGHGGQQQVQADPAHDDGGSTGLRMDPYLLLTGRGKVQAQHLGEYVRRAWADGDETGARPDIVVDLWTMSTRNHITSCTVQLDAFVDALGWGPRPAMADAQTMIGKETLVAAKERCAKVSTSGSALLLDIGSSDSNSSEHGQRRRLWLTFSRRLATASQNGVLAWPAGLTSPPVAALSFALSKDSLVGRHSLGPAPPVITIGESLPSLQLPLWLGMLSTCHWQRWAEPRFTVVVITQRRLASLQRLCRSLLAADYLGDRVDLIIRVDAHAENSRVVDYVTDSLLWPHGHKDVQVRLRPGGLAVAVAESWFPADRHHSYGVLLEDDVSVSPLWYGYAKQTVLRLRYCAEPAADAPNAAASSAAGLTLFGISLYTPRLLELEYPRQAFRPDAMPALADTTAFFYQLPSSWGMVVFPERWRQFRDYLGARMAGGALAQQPVAIPGSASNGWQGSWKKHLIELLALAGWAVLYPNFPAQASLSTNHLEPGEHIGAASDPLEHRPEDYTVPLLGETGQGHLGWLTWSTGGGAVPLLDLFGRPATPADLRTRAQDWQRTNSLCLATAGSDARDGDALQVLRRDSLDVGGINSGGQGRPRPGRLPA